MMKHNRKEENIQLLIYLLNKVQTDPSLDDMRLGQLLLNCVDESLLYHIESVDLQNRIENEFKQEKVELNNKTYYDMFDKFMIVRNNLLSKSIKEKMSIAQYVENFSTDEDVELYLSYKLLLNSSTGLND